MCGCMKQVMPFAATFSALVAAAVSFRSSGDAMLFSPFVVIHVPFFVEPKPILCVLIRVGVVERRGKRQQKFNKELCFVSKIPIWTKRIYLSLLSVVTNGGWKIMTTQMILSSFFWHKHKLYIGPYTFFSGIGLKSKTKINKIKYKQAWFSNS